MKNELRAVTRPPDDRVDLRYALDALTTALTRAEARGADAVELRRLRLHRGAVLQELRRVLAADLSRLTLLQSCCSLLTRPILAQRVDLGLDEVDASDTLPGVHDLEVEVEARPERDVARRPHAVRGAVLIEFALICVLVFVPLTLSFAHLADVVAQRWPGVSLVDVVVDMVAQHAELVYQRNQINGGGA